MLKIVTWLWDTGKPHWKKPIKFDQNHVNILANMFRRHLHIPHEMVCITDQIDGFNENIRIIPLWNDYNRSGGCFRRLKIFSDEMAALIGKRFVSVDLDVVLVGDITPIFDLLELNAKFVVSTFVFDIQLKRVDFPTFVIPIIPHCKLICFYF